MKKIVLLLSVLSSLFIISGCGNSDSQSKDDNNEKTVTASAQSKYADKAFLEDFKQGLYDRWDYQNSKESDKDYDSNLVTFYKNLNDKELNSVKKYKNANFKDTQLHEYALSYINNLEKLNTLKGYDYIIYDHSDSEVTNYDIGAEKYGNLYNKRIVLIKEIVSKYNIKINSKHKDSIDDVLDNAKLVVDKQQEIDSVNNIFKNVTFAKNPNTENEYTAVVENNTNNTFKKVICKYRLLLSDDTVVGEDYVIVEEWAPHQKYTITIQPTVNFNKTELLDCLYEIKQ